MTRWLFVVLACLATDPASADPPQPGDLIVSTPGYPAFREALVVVDPQTGSQRLLSQDSLFGGVTDLAITNDGEIYCASQSSAAGGPGYIMRVDPQTGGQSILASGGSLSSPSGMALGSDGSLLVADIGFAAGQGVVLRINPSNGTQVVLASGPALGSPVDVAETPDGKVLILDSGDYPTPGRLLELEPASGTIGVFASGLSFPHSIEVTPSGTIYVGYADHISEFDASTHAETMVAGGGSLFYALFGLDLEPSGQLVAATGETQHVLRVDPITGTGTILSAAGLLDYPLAIGVWPDLPVPATTTTWGSLKARYR